MPFAPFQQPQPPDGGGAGGRIGEAANTAANLGVGIAAAKAGANHYQQGASLGEAAGLGAGAFVRWMVWLMFFVLWWVIVVTNSMLGGLAANWSGAASQVNDSLFHMAVMFALAPFTMGVTWCRNSDYSLFRRGPIYRSFAPIACMVERVPTWAMYLPVLIFAVV